VALHYFVDGYNLIRAADWLSAGPLRGQRDRLLKFIEEKRPQGNNRVTVVFDGREDVTSPPHGGPTQVLFSSGGDADALLKRRVDELSNPRAAVVVTDDRAIQKWVRGVGARIMACGAFLKAGSRAAPAQARGDVDRPEAEVAEEINEELKKLWKLK
jgi:predicted RNA-binding protein with PIN domain